MSKSSQALTLEEARQCTGFWKFSAILHAAAVQDGTLREPGYAELKDAMIRDYNAWTIASALLATVGIGGLFLHVDPITIDDWPTATRVAMHLYLVSMAVSTMLALSCVNDFISIGNYYNMVPAPYCIHARSHQYSTGNKRHPLTIRVQTWLGLGYGSQVFYQSVSALCFGIVNLLFLIHGAEYCLIPAAVFILFVFQMKEYNRGVHWHELCLPAFCRERGLLDEE